MKLSKRLTQIESMVISGYTHIWDCCCDHGFLGAALLSRQAAPAIHFVDIVPELMQVLESKLQRCYPDSASVWTTHCLDVGTLLLQQYAGKHLVIIAGVGGDLMAELIEAIHQNHPTAQIDFLLCTVRDQYKLRLQLIELDFSLKHEVLVEENQRFYEILLVSTTPDERAKISPFGDKIWQASTTEQAKTVERYRDKTLRHYRRLQLGGSTKVQHIIDAYGAMTI